MTILLSQFFLFLSKFTKIIDTHISQFSILLSSHTDYTDYTIGDILSESTDNCF